jgi:hypothetical protein
MRNLQQTVHLAHIFYASATGTGAKRNAFNRLKETTDLILADLERNSEFF